MPRTKIDRDLARVSERARQMRLRSAAARDRARKQAEAARRMLAIRPGIPRSSESES